MRKMLVMTKDGRRSHKLGTLLNNEQEIQTKIASNSATDPKDADVDTLFVDVESLLDKNASITQALEALWSDYPSASIVVMADDQQTKMAVDAVKAGAFGYLHYPIEQEELGLVIDRVRESDVLHSELDYLRDQFWDEDSLDFVNTRSQSMRDIFSKIRQVAGTRTTVLLTGETGTGKSLIAKLIHKHSSRKDMPFISVHCGAIPDSLVESELFGHEKGAFTGAIKRKLGKFELAEGGTLFLDEIGTISQSVQIKLLNVLQERIIQRVGGEKDIPVDVRIITATNDDMAQLCEEGSFRRDLYYRLNVFPIQIPPLRERSEDIARLTEGFIAYFNGQLNTEIKGVHPTVLARFGDYDWPGNVRELENVIERACILEPGEILLPQSFPTDILGNRASTASHTIDMKLKEARQRAIDKFERQYLTTLLKDCNGIIKTAAEKAGITPRQLNKLMHRHNLKRNDFKKKELPVLTRQK